MANGHGWINAHTHLYSGLAPFGLPQPSQAPRAFIDVLRSIWWRLDRALDPASLRASARYYVADALLSGTTGLIDHHESPSCIEGSLDVLADACQELGMRALLCYGVTERNGGRDEARRGLAECRRFFTTNQRPLVRGAVGVHAAFTVSDETLREAGDLARELGAVVHLHVAEDQLDVDDARERGYTGLLERLFDTQALPPGSLLAHGVKLTEDEVVRAADAELWLVQNPRSNGANAVGYPVALRRSSRVALGTDGFPSDRLDEAERLLIEAARSGDDLEAAAARIDGGEALFAALGFDDDVQVDCGRIRVGARVIARDGQLLSVDLAALHAEASAEAEELWKRMEAM